MQSLVPTLEELPINEVVAVVPPTMVAYVAYPRLAEQSTKSPAKARFCHMDRVTP